MRSTPSEGMLDPDHQGRQQDGARGPWEPVRTRFTPRAKNQLVVKLDRLKGTHQDQGLTG